MNKHQLGFVEEVTYGTPVVVNRFLPILAGETLERSQTVITSSGLQPGNRAPRGATRNLVKRAAGGAFECELPAADIGLFFEHALGAVATNNPQAGVYEHTYSPGDLTKSMTIQKGVEQDDGTVQPFTFHGCKITELELRVALDQYAIARFSVDAEDVDTSTGLATASYNAPNLLDFSHASIELDDGAVGLVREARIRIANQFDVDRYHLGQSGVKSEPRENDFRQITASLVVDFDGTTSWYDRMTADTSAKLELIFENAVDLGGGNNEKVHVTMYDVRVVGEGGPKIGGVEVPQETVNVEAYEDASGNLVDILQVTGDATP